MSSAARAAAIVSATFAAYVVVHILVHNNSVVVTFDVDVTVLVCLLVVNPVPVLLHKVWY